MPCQTSNRSRAAARSRPFISSQRSAPRAICCWRCGSSSAQRCSCGASSWRCASLKLFPCDALSVRCPRRTRTARRTRNEPTRSLIVSSIAPASLASSSHRVVSSCGRLSFSHSSIASHSSSSAWPSAEILEKLEVRRGAPGACSACCACAPREPPPAAEREQRAAERCASAHAIARTRRTPAAPRATRRTRSPRRASRGPPRRAGSRDRRARTLQSRRSHGGVCPITNHATSAAAASAPAGTSDHCQPRRAALQLLERAIPRLREPRARRRVEPRNALVERSLRALVLELDSPSFIDHSLPMLLAMLLEHLAQPMHGPRVVCLHAAFACSSSPAPSAPRRAPRSCAA